MARIVCFKLGNTLLLCILSLLTAVTAPFAGVANGQVAFEEAPINYLKAKSNDRVAKLIEKIENGSVTLRYDDQHGYLRSVLKELDVSTSSQVLVFSQTSLQLRYISTGAPRALYFNDDIYVGWCQGGDIIEISAVDPVNGPYFYSLDQHQPKKPQIKRESYECLQCHATTLTGGFPGHTVRSVFTSVSGRLERSTKTYLTDHTSPLNERWGGWYVSGEHGEQRHMGNLPRRPNSRISTNDLGANVTDLGRFFNTLPYLTRHSDIVALMVLEHQAKMHNLITEANYLTRIAKYQLTHGEGETPNAVEKKASDSKAGRKKRDNVAERSRESSDSLTETQLVSFQESVAKAGEPLVKYMLMSGEMEIADEIVGSSRFTKDFAARGPRDKQDRSLRDFDLKKRMFKYPCSYLIYSEAFDRLPGPVRSYVYRRVLEVLTGQDTSDDWKHLSKEDRRAILEILCDTKQGLPASYAEAL